MSPLLLKGSKADANMLVFTVVMQRDRPGLELRSMWSSGRRVHFSAGAQRSVSHAVTAAPPQSLFFICSHSVPQTDLSPSASAKAPLSQLSFLPYAAHFPPPHETPKKKLQISQRPSAHHEERGRLPEEASSLHVCLEKGVAEGTCRRERLDGSQSPG